LAMSAHDIRATSGFPPAMTAGRVADLIPIRVDSEEFSRMSEKIMACVNGHNDDYTRQRAIKGLRPTTFQVIGLTRIVNKTLQHRFELARAWLTRQGRSAAELKVKIAFHGTRTENIPKICQTGLLRIGHPLNSSASTDDGYFGSPKHGVNVSAYVDYVLKYSNGQIPMQPDTELTVLMFVVLPGRSKHIPKMTMGMLPSAGYDSHSSANHLEWFLFDESLACPVYEVRIRALDDLRTAADDEVEEKQHSLVLSAAGHSAPLVKLPTAATTVGQETTKHASEAFLGEREKAIDMIRI